MSTDQSSATPTSAPKDSTQETAVRLGQRLRRARLSRSLTQGEVARNLFSISYISAVERGQIRPSLGALERLAERLQVSLTDLVGEGEVEIRPTISSAGRHESASERHREEVDSGLREAQILLRQHKRDEAIGMLLRLPTQQLSPRESAAHQLTLAQCYLEQGRAEQAGRVAQDALALAERAGEGELAVRLRNELGRTYSLMQNYTGALEQFRACLQADQEQGTHDPGLRLDILMDIATQQWNLGEHDQALSTLQEALEVAEEVARPEWLAEVYWSRSQVLKTRGDAAAARSYAVRSLAAYEMAAVQRSVTAIHIQLGLALARSGQTADALAQLQWASSTASGKGDLAGIAEAERNLAWLYLDEKRSNEAQQAAHAALSAAERLGDAVCQASTILVLARVQEARRHTSEATASFERVLALLQPLDSPAATALLSETYAVFSEYLERRGESARAFAMLKQAYSASHHS